MKKNDNVSAFDSCEYDEKIRKTLPYYDEFYKQMGKSIFRSQLMNT